VCGREWCEFGVVSLCCVWDSLLWVWGSECLLCVGEFGAGLVDCVFAVCGRVWGVFGGMCLFCVWGSYLWDCGSECVLCVGQFGACLEIVSVCCVWDSLERVWWIDFELCVGEIRAGLRQ